MKKLKEGIEIMKIHKTDIVRRMKSFVVCISILLSISTVTFAGGGYLFLFWGSIDWEALFKGIPSSSDGFANLEVDFRVIDVNCDNPAGNSSSANATVHLDQSASVNTSTGSGDWYLLKGGKVLVEGDIIPDAEILFASGITSADVCPNGNWLLTLSSVRDFDARATLVLDNEETVTYEYDNCDFGPNPQPGDQPYCENFNIK
jgi:hypothetical protein